MDKVFDVTLQLRSKTEAQWLASDYIPLKSEPCVVEDGDYAGKVKFGDGIHLWKELPYSTEIIYDGNLTIRVNDEEVGTFSANSKVDKEINIEVPTHVSELENDSKYITAKEAPVQSVNGKTGAVQLTRNDIQLSNVDNTADKDKPVSSAQAEAIKVVANSLKNYQDEVSEGTITVDKARKDSSGNLIEKTYATRTYVQQQVDTITPSIGENGHWFIGDEDTGVIAQQGRMVEATLIADGWQGEAAPYTQSLTIEGVTATSFQAVYVSGTATEEQKQAWEEAAIGDGGQAENTIVLTAYGIKPTANIPILILVGAIAVSPGGGSYALPKATETELGGVRAPTKTETMTSPVGIDDEGTLWTEPGSGTATLEDDGTLVFAGGSGSSYTLPVMSSEVLGGGKAIPKTDDMRSMVGVDSDGKLWCAEGAIAVIFTPTTDGVTCNYRLDELRDFALSDQNMYGLVVSDTSEGGAYMYIRDYLTPIYIEFGEEEVPALSGIVFSGSYYRVTYQDEITIEDLSPVEFTDGKLDLDHTRSIVNIKDTYDYNDVASLGYIYQKFQSKLDIQLALDPGGYSTTGLITSIYADKHYPTVTLSSDGVTDPEVTGLIVGFIIGYYPKTFVVGVGTPVTVTVGYVTDSGKFKVAVLHLDDNTTTNAEIIYPHEPYQSYSINIGSTVSGSVLANLISHQPFYLTNSVSTDADTFPPQLITTIMDFGLFVAFPVYKINNDKQLCYSIITVGTSVQASASNTIILGG